MQGKRTKALFPVVIAATWLLAAPAAFAGDEGGADESDPPAEEVATEAPADAPPEPACDKGISMTPDELVASLNAPDC